MPTRGEDPSRKYTEAERAKMARFGRRLRALRVGAGYPSQYAAAQASGLDRPLINRIESGARQPTALTIMTLCETLRIDPRILMTDVEEGKGVEKKKGKSSVAT